jgi:DNA-binding FrmR family transcriptional regulator
MAGKRSSPADAPLHRSHKAVGDRLKRAEGHVRNVISMLESGRECVDIAQQLHAVIRALESAKTTLIHDHIDHCLEAAVGSRPRRDRAVIEQFKAITRYL